MKSTFSRLITILVLLAILAAGCAPAAEKPTAETGQPFKVAIVMPSSITDMAFSQSMFEGLKKVQTEMGGESAMEIAYSENLFKVPDAAAAIRDYAAKGYNLVIAHGSQYGTSLEQIAPDFPNTAFAWGTSMDTFQASGINNVFAYQAEAQQGGYVLGTIAALMSKTGTKVNVTYTGSFSDVSLMATAAETHIAAGADMLTGSSQSVVGAIGVCKDKGVYWFGTQWDQTSLAPEAVVASQVYDWTGILKDMLKGVQAGVMGVKSYTLTFKNGVLVIADNPAITVPADAKAAADAAIAGINDGTIVP